MKRATKGYYCGLVKDYKNPKRIILQMRRDKDYLDCELWVYLGQCIITKQYAKTNKAALIQAINQQFNKSFTRITID